MNEKCSVSRELRDPAKLSIGKKMDGLAGAVELAARVRALLGGGANVVGSSSDSQEREVRSAIETLVGDVDRLAETLDVKDLKGANSLASIQAAVSALPCVVAMMLVCRDGLGPALPAAAAGQTVVLERRALLQVLHKPLLALSVRVLGGIALFYEATPAASTSIRAAAQQTVTAVLPLGDCAVGVDFSAIKAVWGCVVKVVAWLRATSAAPAVDVSVPVANETIQCLVRAARHSFERLQRAQDAKAANKALGLLRFVLGHVASIMKCHGGVPLSNETLQQLLPCIVAVRSYLPPCPESLHLFTSECETLQRQVSTGLDFVLSVLLSKSTGQTDDTRRRTFEYLLLAGPTNHLGRLQFLVVVLHNWHNLKIDEAVLGAGSSSGGTKSALDCLNVMHDLVAAVDPTVWIPPPTNAAALAPGGATTTSGSSPDQASSASGALSHDHMHWHVCTTLATAALLLLTPAQVAAYEARLLQEALAASLPAASLAIDVYVSLASALGERAARDMAALVFDVAAALQIGNPSAVDAAGDRMRRLRRPMLLAATHQLLALLKPEEAASLCQQWVQSVEQHRPEHRPLLAATAISLIIRRPAPLTPALSSALKSAHDLVLSRLLLSLESGPAEASGLCWELAATINVPILGHALVLLAQGRLLAVFRRLVSLLRSSSSSAAAATAASATAADWAGPWLAWAATFMPLLGDYPDVVVAVLTHASSLCSSSTAASLRVCLGKLVTACAQLNPSDGRLRQSIIPPLRNIVTLAIGQPNWYGRVDAIRRFVLFSDRFATDPSFVESLLHEGTKNATVIY